MARVVPEQNRRLGPVVLVADRAEAGCAEKEESTVRGGQAQAARDEHAREVSAGKEEDVSVKRANPFDDAIGAPRDLVGHLAGGAPVAEQLTVWAIGQDLARRAAFVLAVVPLDQIRIDLAACAKTCQLTRSQGPLKRARPRPRFAPSRQRARCVDAPDRAEGIVSVGRARVGAGPPSECLSVCEAEEA